MSFQTFQHDDKAVLVGLKEPQTIVAEFENAKKYVNRPTVAENLLTTSEIKEEGKEDLAFEAFRDHAALEENLFMLLKHKGLTQKIERKFSVQISHDGSNVNLDGKSVACQNAKESLFASVKDLHEVEIDVHEKIHAFMADKIGKEEVSDMLLSKGVFVIAQRSTANKLKITCVQNDDAITARAVLLANFNDDYFRKKTASEKVLENIPVERCKCVYLYLYGQSKILLVEKEFMNSVRIEIPKHCKNIVIEGGNADVIKAKEKIDIIINDIKFKKMCLQQPGVVRLFGKETVKSFKSGVEKEFSVMIINGVVTTETDFIKIGGQDCSSETKVELVIGSIADQKSDVIVNSTSPYLKLNLNPSSRALSIAAGPSLQTFCDQLASSTTMSKDTIVRTPGFNLNCQEVFHVFAGGGIQKIRNVVMDVLCTASAIGYHSVSFPAIGTGRGGLDRDIIANMFYSEINEFYKMCNSQSSLTKVFIVAFHTDIETIAAFKKVFQFRNHPQNQVNPSQNPNSKPSNIENVLPKGPSSFFSSIAKFFGLPEPGESKKKSEKIEKNTNDDPRSGSGITLYIYGFKSSNIDKAFERINTFISEYNIETTQELPLAMKLEISEIHDIKQFASRSNVVADFDKRGNITLKGDAKDIPNVTKYCTELYVKKAKNESLEELPPHWSPMPLSGQHATCICVPVPKGSSEYSKVVDKISQTSGGKMIKDIHVSRIQNPQLYRGFMLKKRSMDEKGGKGSNEMQLFHGTSADTCEEINHHGFNRSFAGKNATAYGKGSYFATTSHYSMSYAIPSSAGMRYMYVARVLVGDFTGGTSDMKTPPKKYFGSKEIFDSTTNSVFNPTIFVVYHDNQAYPEYLVSFFSF